MTDEHAAGTAAPAVKQPLSRRQRILDVIGWPVWVFDSFFLAQIVVVVFLILLGIVGVSFESVNEAVYNTVLSAVIYTVTLLIVFRLPMPRRKPPVTLKNVGLNRLLDWQDMLLAPAGFIVYAIISAILTYTVIRLVPDFNSEQVQEVGFQHISRSYEYVLAFITLVVVAPIAEEVLMRGYLYGKLRKIMPKLGAMLLTAAVFALLHMQWNVAIDVFALSLILTSLREVSGSIWAGILLHMLKNGVAFYFLFINPIV